MGQKSSICKSGRQTMISEEVNKESIISASTDAQYNHPSSNTKIGHMGKAGQRGQSHQSGIRSSIQRQSVKNQPQEKSNASIIQQQLPGQHDDYSKIPQINLNKKEQLEALKNERAVKIRLSWSYGGKEAFVIGTFTNWEYMIKMNKVEVQKRLVFEVSMYVKEGTYYYHFVVDGKVRFAPDQPSAINYKHQIVNFIEIDQYSIKSEEETGRIQKITSVAECVGDIKYEKIGENIEKMLKDKHDVSINDDYKFNMSMEDMFSQQSQEDDHYFQRLLNIMKERAENQNQSDQQSLYPNTDNKFQSDQSYKSSDLHNNYNNSHPQKKLNNHQSDKEQHDQHQEEVMKHVHFLPSSTFLDKADFAAAAEEPRKEEKPDANQYYFIEF